MSVEVGGADKVVEACGDAIIFVGVFALTGDEVGSLVFAMHSHF